MENRTMVTLLCGLLCLTTGALVTYGILSDSQPALLFGIVAGLAAAGIGNGLRSDSDTTRR